MNIVLRKMFLLLSVVLDSDDIRDEELITFMNSRKGLTSSVEMGAWDKDDT